MASLSSNAQQSQLCAYCHQKAKYGNYQYCSKTCAGQAATLCNHCQKKPKYQNYEFCGKNCAALAAAAGPGNQPQAAPKSTGGATYNNPQKASNPVFDPVQLAKLVAQHIPQVQAMLAPTAPSQAPPVAALSQPLQKAVPPVAAAPQPSVKSPSRNNPFVNISNNQALAPLATNPNVPAPPSMQAQTDGVTQELPECLIPGCGKPVHADSSGSKTSEYCSMRHREQAVADGLVSPCIMCLTLPQSDADYFCGRECREEAMSKPAE